MLVRLRMHLVHRHTQAQTAGMQLTRTDVELRPGLIAVASLMLRAPPRSTPAANTFRMPVRLRMHLVHRHTQAQTAGMQLTLVSYTHLREHDI